MFVFEYMRVCEYVLCMYVCVRMRVVTTTFVISVCRRIHVCFEVVGRVNIPIHECIYVNICLM